MGFFVRGILGLGVFNRVRQLITKLDPPSAWVLIAYKGVRFLLCHFQSVTMGERYAVIGHSYINRLHQHLLQRRYDRFPGRRTNVNLDLGSTVLWKGIRGGTVPTILHQLESCLSNRPTRVFLQVGSNEIRRPLTAEQVVARILGLVNELKRRGVQSVFVGKLVGRSKVSRSQYTPKEYNAIVREVNMELRRLCEHTTGIFYWPHKGIMHKNLKAHDGVHFVPGGRGELKFYRSIRQALRRNNDIPYVLRQRGKRGKKRGRRRKKPVQPKPE